MFHFFFLYFFFGEGFVITGDAEAGAGWECVVIAYVLFPEEEEEDEFDDDVVVDDVAGWVGIDVVLTKFGEFEEFKFEMLTIEVTFVEGLFTKVGACCICWSCVGIGVVDFDDVGWSNFKIINFFFLKKN